MDNFATLTADGNSSVFTVAGQTLLILSDDFGGGTATVQVKQLNGTWTAMTDGSFTSDTTKLIEFPKKVRIEARVNLTGATSPNLYVELRS